MKRTGERDALLEAFGSSFPRLDRTPPTTVTLGSTAFSASYVSASIRSYPIAATAFPLTYCGCQKRG